MAAEQPAALLFCLVMSLSAGGSPYRFSECLQPFIHEIEQDIESDCPGAVNRRRKERMMRAVSHTSRSQSMRTLAGALESLVKIERQAYQIGAQGRGEKKTTSLEERIRGYAKEELRGRRKKQPETGEQPDDPDSSR